jgi:hypothetical protein
VHPCLIWYSTRHTTRSKPTIKKVRSIRILLRLLLGFIPHTSYPTQPTYSTMTTEAQTTGSPLPNNVIGGDDENVDELVLRESLHAAKLESIQLQKQLDQVVAAAEQDISGAKVERVNLIRANQILETKVKELVGETQRLQMEKHKLKETTEEQQTEITALKRESKQLQMDHETQEARREFVETEMQNSNRHVELLEHELTDLRGTCNKFTESSTSHDLYYRSTIDVLKKEKKHAEMEVEKVLDRNKNQASLLQRLEKKLFEVKDHSEKQIDELKQLLKEDKKKATHLLQEEQKKVMKLSKNNQNNGNFSMRSIFATPLSPKAGSSSNLSQSPSESPLSSPRSPGGTHTFSPKRGEAMQEQKEKFASLRDLLNEEQDPTRSMDKRISRRTSSEIRVNQAKSERSAWKDKMDNWDMLPADGGIQSSSQSVFLESAIKKAQKKGLWDNLFGPKEEEIVLPMPTTLEEQVSDSSLLTREIMQAMQENDQMQAEREERNRAREAQEKEKAQENVKQMKSAVKWGIFNMFNATDEEDSSEDEKEEDEKKGDGAFDEDIDIDTLRWLAANRTAGLTEESLNQQMQRYDDESQSTFSSQISHDLGFIKEERESKRYSLMSDITVPSEEFMVDQNEMIRAVQQTQQES